MAGVLRQPDPRVVTPRKAAAVLRHLGLDWAAEPGYVPTPLPPIVPLTRNNPRDWWVGGEAMVTYHGDPEGFPFRGRWSCDRAPRAEGRCWEVAAAILVHCWNRADLRPLFDTPGWSLDLLELMAPAAPEEPPERRRGWIRYRLIEPGVAHDGPLPVARELMRLSRRDGRPLKPKPMPPTLDEIEERVLGLGAVDRAFHDLRDALLALRRPPLDMSPERVEQVRARLRARAFALLLEVGDLWLGEDPISASEDPFEPLLDAMDGPDGIVLRWRKPIIAAYRAGPGYVVTAEGVLRPLTATHLAKDPTLLDAPLPTVPTDEAEAFVERFVLTSGIAVQTASEHLPPTVEPEALEGWLQLDEDDGELVLEQRLVYRHGESSVSVDPDVFTPQQRAGEHLLRRDRQREAALVESAHKALGHPLPVRLSDDAALRVLVEGLPALPPEWRVEGTEGLRRYRVSGRLTPRVSIPSGIDWLDLRVGFTIGEQTLDAAAVLESWRAGRQFHRLDDGTLAALPTAWLERHGAVGEEIDALRRAAGGRLQAHAAPLVAELLAQAEGDRARWAAVKARLDAIDTLPDREPPAELQAELRSYQHTGFRWLAWLRDLGLGGVLADDMGLGKTVQALALLLETHLSPGAPSLVVAPTSVIYNWADEAARFTPQLSVHVHHGPQRPAAPPEGVDVVITSYALLRADEAAFDRPWRVFVLDEAQRIKNPRSHVARSARNINADHRFALTGTPLENHLLELWSIFECLMPGFFGSRATFQRRYALPIERDHDEHALATLRARLRPFVLRRLKQEVAQELPPRQEQILYCELGEEQRRLYERVKATYRAAVLKRIDTVGLARSTLPVLEALMRLRQACCDPGLLPFPEARAIEHSAKIELLLETLEETIAAGHRTLVFSQWTSLLKRVAPRLDERGWPYLYLDGSTRQRQALVHQWNDPEGPPVFLISLKAGGSGLNLTGADHVVHLDPWWNPAVEDQATDRAHRIGQTRPVVAYKIVARGTVEEKVLALQARKRALFDAAVDQGRLSVEQLTREDLEAVLAPADPDAMPLVDEGALFGQIDLPPAPRLTDDGPVDDINELLQTGERLTNARVRRAMGWSAEQARMWLRAQVNAGLLEKRGRKRGTYYIVPDRPG